MADTISIKLGERTFTLDREKAEDAYSAKKVINGRNSMFFNILPLKYTWAYCPLQGDEELLTGSLARLHSKQISCSGLRWMSLAKCSIRWPLGALARSQEIAQSGGIYTIRDLVTAPELKLVFGRFVHEENTRSDILVYLHGSLSINPMECSALANTPAMAAKQQFMVDHLSPIDRDTDTTILENKQAIVRNVFLMTHCMEGTQYFLPMGIHLLFSCAKQDSWNG